MRISPEVEATRRDGIRSSTVDQGYTREPETSVILLDFQTYPGSFCPLRGLLTGNDRKWEISKVVGKEEFIRGLILCVLRGLEFNCNKHGFKHDHNWSRSCSLLVKEAIKKVFFNNYFNQNNV